MIDCFKKAALLILLSVAAMPPAWSAGLEAKYLTSRCAAFLSDENYTAAYPRCKRAAELGNPQAQYFLGYMYDEGWGVSQNKTAAAEWYRLSAGQGYANGQVEMAWTYFYGDGVPKDRKAAAKWFRMAAVQGDGTGLKMLGLMHVVGEGAAEDKQEGYVWLSLAAEQGDETAQEKVDELATELTPQQIQAAEDEAARRAEDFNHYLPGTTLGELYYIFTLW